MSKTRLQNRSRDTTHTLPTPNTQRGVQTNSPRKSPHQSVGRANRFWRRLRRRKLTFETVSLYGRLTFGDPFQDFGAKRRTRERERTGYEPFALHAPRQWAVEGYVSAEQGVVKWPCRLRLGANHCFLRERYPCFCSKERRTIGTQISDSCGSPKSSLFLRYCSQA